MTPNNSLRRRRLGAGLTQTELAARAGVSRSLVSAVEAGNNTPAVDAALALAGALATTVEELFAEEVPDVVPVLDGHLRDGALVRVGGMAERVVAAELPDHGIAGAAWATPDGVIENGELKLFPAADPAGVVLAGCDPALGVAESMLGGLGPLSLFAIAAPTGTAIASLERGRLHAALVHNLPASFPEPTIPVVRLHFARWQVGLAVTPKLRHRSVEAVLQSNVPIAQRAPAAASQQAFDRALLTAGIETPPPGPHAAGHIDAARLAATLQAAAITTESAARAFDLHFLALEEHLVELWIADRWLDHPGINALGELLSTTAFTRRVAHFGGYDLTRCGERTSRP